MSDFKVGVDWTTPQHGNSAHADLEATISEQAAEIERLKTVPMKYRRMRFNAALQDENAALKAELDGEKAAALNYRTDTIKAEKQRDELLAAIDKG